MLELGQTNGAAPAGGNVKDISEADFMAEVVDASQEVPVIVDFWAPWCGPCKTLGPALEEAVNAMGGKVKMVKVNVDENQQIAGQLRVQSIPTVYAFSGGQPVDGFQGALPPSQVKEFVQKVAAMGGDGGDGLADAIAAAEEMLDVGQVDDAAQTFAAILEEDQALAAAYAGLAKCHIAKGDVEGAEAVLNGAPAEISHAAEIDAVHAQIALARQAESAGPVDELRAKVEASPDDHQARFDLAQALYASGKTEEAVAELLELFRRDREWNDGAAKQQLFTIFEALAPNDPIALTGRRKLSSMILA
ncbi:thioredoxin [Maritimibacter alkaliphilus HTCC2654]|uniref:Thioredoxin n=1 Tax=Maritimibacter alkaliphilus HTCC2654 TaxID=314271 RepID=A3VML8_9RHOB|nr:thioredoxin [Maritimibacter alkaliphilus]EAQ10520.1 thioredoxin [Rhodobacterales bacterium HTCC2654] [Maritimibacter alkaliphilus HTCC2654]TYP84500.1 thioredoxin [Maritimibacter alkaliphilus HTCC2654]